MQKQVPLYLYTGPEFGERDEAVKKVLSGLQKQYSEIDEHYFYIPETPFNEIMTILQSGTLFSNGVFVVCKNAELLKKKEDIDMISSWLKNTEPTTALVLVSDDISVDAKLEKLVPPANRIKFWEMFENKKLPWVQNFFQKNGYKIGEDASQLILDLIENNTQALASECSRFFLCFPKEHEITEEDVESILTHDREENSFTLFNQISDNSVNAHTRFEKGLGVLQKIRFSKESSSVMIIAGLASCFRKLILYCKKGDSAIFGKTMQKQYAKAAQIWSVGQATAILADLASTDMEIRSGGSTMEDVLLQKLLYEIVIKKGARIQSIQSE